MEPQSDTDLIAKCIAGEVEVYQVLVDRYSSRIVNLAYMMIGDRHEAEDVAQYIETVLVPSFDKWPEAEAEIRQRVAV